MLISLIRVVIVERHSQDKLNFVIICLFTSQLLNIIYPKPQARVSIKPDLAIISVLSLREFPAFLLPFKQP